MKISFLNYIFFICFSVIGSSGWSYNDPTRTMTLEDFQHSAQEEKSNPPLLIPITANSYSPDTNFDLVTPRPQLATTNRPSLRTTPLPAPSTNQASGAQSASSLIGHQCSPNNTAFQCQVCNCYFEAGKSTTSWRDKDAIIETVLNRKDLPEFPNTTCGVVWQASRRGGPAFSWTSYRVRRRMGHTSIVLRNSSHLKQCVQAANRVLNKYNSGQQIACYTNYYSPSGMHAYRRRGVRIRSLIPSFAQGKRYTPIGGQRFICNHGSSDYIARLRGNSNVQVASAQNQTTILQ